jgi:hypothetical protein
MGRTSEGLAIAGLPEGNNVDHPAQPVSSIAPNVLDRSFEVSAPNRKWMDGPRKAGFTMQP